MDSFSLLKYWRSGGGSGGSASTTRDSAKRTHNTTDSCSSAATTTTTIVTAVSPSSSDSDDDNDDDGPFFDLEFTLPDDSDTEDQTKEERNIAAIVEDFASDNDFEEVSFKAQNHKEVVADVLSDDNEVIEGDEIKFTLSSSSSSDSVDPNITLSPSDDLFFKGRLVPMESSSLSLSSSESEAITKFPAASILKSATKFRVLMLNFNKSRTNVREKTKKSEATVSSSKEGQDKRSQSRFFTVKLKLKVEEVPLVSLFTRDNSSKGNNNKGSKKSNNDVQIPDSSSSSSSVADDKKFSKDVMQKYLKKVKPLYIRVSKRYSEKLRFSGQLSFPKSATSPSSTPPLAAEVKPPPEKSTDPKPGSETLEVAEVVAVANPKSQKQGNLQAGLRVVCKHLGKSRSASSAAMAVAPTPQLTSNRRDDSLLQQQDGIQGAILHCKRSFNASRDLEGSILSRSASDPSHEKSVGMPTEDSSSSSQDANGQMESTVTQNSVE